MKHIQICFIYKDKQYVTQAQLLSFHSVSAGVLKAVVGL